MKRIQFSKSIYVVAMFVGFSFASCENEEVNPQSLADLNEVSNTKGKTTTSSSTVQNFMVAMETIQTEMEGDTKWRFDDAAMAVKYFPNDKNGIGLANSQKCIFFNGGKLNDGREVEAKEGWGQIGSGGEEASAPELNIMIAGQSVVKHPKNGTKYSFSLTADRVSNITVEILKGGTQVAYHEVGSNFTINQDPAFVGAFDYQGNAGPFGDLSLTDLLKTGTIASILLNNKDSYGSSDVAGGIAVLNTIPLPTDPGAYDVIVSGTIKGNTDEVYDKFTIRGVSEVTEPCQNKK